MTPEVEKRMKFIAKTLKKNGKVNRSDIADEFDISFTQASADFKRYQTLYGPLVYDQSSHCYREKK